MLSFSVVNSSPKYLITGASGFIGTHLQKRLRDAKIPFDVISRATTPWPDGLKLIDLSPYDAIFHLAQSPILQSTPWEKVTNDNLVPIQHFTQQIEKTNPRCRFIYVSSQSSKPNTDSQYGKVKWFAEEALKKSSISYVVIRPGLVFGKIGEGLFGRIAKLIQMSPIIPLIGNGKQLIQPVPISTVIDSMLKVASAPAGDLRMDYAIAYPPILFQALLQEVSNTFQKRTLFIKIPMWIVRSGLFVLETLLKNPPMTSTSLNGLLDLEVMPTTSRDLGKLGLSLPPLTEAIHLAFENKNHD